VAGRGLGQEQSGFHRGSWGLIGKGALEAQPWRAA